MMEYRRIIILAPRAQPGHIAANYTLTPATQTSVKSRYSSSWGEPHLMSYGTSLAIWDHTVLPATRHKRTHPALTPAMQAGTRFTYLEGCKAELT